MKTLRYTVRFTTPAFLGNAEQSGQWRTPPFKALLRQWWRVVRAADHGFREELPGMHEAEARLFGAAADKAGAAVNRKSLVRLRLDKWSNGAETRVKWGDKESRRDQKIAHPEVRQHVGPLLYLGYGPLEPSKRTKGRGHVFVTRLKHNAAIQAGESARLSIAAPGGDIRSIQTALALMNAYGTIGGRSRNGWGSFCLTPVDETPDLTADLTRFFRPWEEALELDWPHALGQSDEGPLLWQTAQPYKDWEQAMRDLAIVKIGLRTQFKFQRGGPHPRPQDRHWLSYPVTTRHAVQGWGKAKLLNSRLPNSLRFKVRPDSGDSSKLRGVIFHVPCLPPTQFRPDERAIEKVWRTVHGFLDRSSPVQLARIGA